MLPTSKNDLNLLSRCGDSSQIEQTQSDQERTKTDTALAFEVDRILWKDTVFRARDYVNVDARVIGGFVHLYGHISSMTSQHQAEKTLQTIPGVSGVVSHLIADDQLLVEVATSLGSLEHIYDCKFFTGVSHGVVFISGKVNDAQVGRLAEKCASENPNVRGVINSVHLYGSKFILQDQLFLQPRIGEEIVFLNGISGMVEQVIINPSNRLVIGMILRGQFTDQLQALTSLKDGKSQPTERLIVIPMDLVRYLTKVSGFLHIKTSERDKYTDFNPADFTTPDKGWVPPYPYCPDHVFFPLQQQVEDIQHVHEPDPFQFAETVEAASLRNDFFANNSPGI